jgi:hypothetical protein
MALERFAHTRPLETDSVRSMRRLVSASKGVAMVSVEVSPRGLMELPLVQILVVVANIQVRTLKTEVEKGSM